MENKIDFEDLFAPNTEEELIKYFKRKDEPDEPNDEQMWGYISKFGFNGIYLAEKIYRGYGHIDIENFQDSENIPILILPQRTRNLERKVKSLFIEFLENHGFIVTLKGQTK